MNISNFESVLYDILVQRASYQSNYAKRMNNPIDKSEFCDALQQQLREDGALEEIAAAVRARIVKSLISNEPKSRPTLPNDVEVAGISLLYHHLKGQGYGGTLSVFAAECRRLQGFISRNLFDGLLLACTFNTVYWPGDNW